jgi:DNA-binding beta-propeller fold protein YncE
MSPRLSRFALLCLLTTTAACAGGAALELPPDVERIHWRTGGPAGYYWIFVGSGDGATIERVRFGRGGAEVEASFALAAPDGAPLYALSLAVDHTAGRLYAAGSRAAEPGALWAFDLADDAPTGTASPAGQGPTAIDLTADGRHAFLADSPDGRVGTVAVIRLADMTEVARTGTCAASEDGHLHPRGTFHYTVCRADDQLVELHTGTYEVTRRFDLAAGQSVAAAAAASELRLASASPAPPPPAACGATAAVASATGDRIYVACGGAAEIMEIDLGGWRLLRRFPTSPALRGLAATDDGRLLIAALADGGGIQVLDLTSGQTRASIPSRTEGSHAVIVSPDSRYAFATSAGSDGGAGQVEVFDLLTLRRVTGIAVAAGARDLAFWKLETGR